MSKIIPAPAKIHITTLGCPKNTADSRHMAGAFTAEGFISVDNADDADILLVNTCGFIKDAKEESIEEVLRLAQMKEDCRKLVVFGCLAARYRNELLKEIPEIDGIWGVGEEALIIEYCKEIMDRRNGESVKRRICENSPVHRLSGSPILSQSSYAYLKIAEGCDKKCTFCVIPSIRGVFRSIRPELKFSAAVMSAFIGSFRCETNSSSRRVVIARSASSAVRSVSVERVVQAGRFCVHQSRRSGSRRRPDQDSCRMRCASRSG